MENKTQKIRNIRKKEIEQRASDELVGAARGVIADDLVNSKETKFLKKWLTANRAYLENDPLANKLAKRVEDALKDGVVDKKESKSLLKNLREYVSSPSQLFTQKSTELALDDPAPEIIFPDKTFCLTGGFVLMGGSRGGIEKYIERLGGAIKRNVTAQLDYLLVGEYATYTWIHSNCGTKIVKAMNYRDKGHPIKIISEEHFSKFMR